MSVHGPLLGELEDVVDSGASSMSSISGYDTILANHPFSSWYANLRTGRGTGVPQTTLVRFKCTEQGGLEGKSRNVQQSGQSSLSS